MGAVIRLALRVRPMERSYQERRERMRERQKPTIPTCTCGNVNVSFPTNTLSREVHPKGLILICPVGSRANRNTKGGWCPAGVVV